MPQWLFIVMMPFSLALPLLLSAPGSWQQDPGRFNDKVDAAIQSAYQTASAQFPCKVKTRGKPKILRWEEVDRCLNEAARRVDWESLARQIEDSRKEYPSVTTDEFVAAVEAALSAHALSYERIFVIKDPRALVPLTNSLLKFLPADSLLNLPVYDKAGTQVGTFLGTYSYERSGGLASANKYRLALFQYADRNGNVQSAGEKLLLDSFGVPWSSASAQRGFRLSSDKLNPNQKD